MCVCASVRVGMLRRVRGPRVGLDEVDEDEVDEERSGVRVHVCACVQVGP